MSPSSTYASVPGAAAGGITRSAGTYFGVIARRRNAAVASATMTAMTPARIRRLRSLRSRRTSSRSKSPGSSSTLRLSRSRASAILGILDLHHLAERVAPVACQRADRRVRDAERIPCLLRREPEDLGQHERRSLPRGKRREDMADDLAVVGVGEVVARSGEPDRSA